MIQIAFVYPMKMHTLLSHSRILICKKAFSMSPHTKIGLNRDLTEISHIEFWSRAPVSRQSFSEAEFLVGFDGPSYTILSLSVSDDSLMTGLCGK